MPRPLLLVQISDPHLGATWAGADPAAGLKAAVESIRGLRPRADAVLLSGDLADHAADAEYEQLLELLAPLELPLYAMAGNHDDRDALRRHFDVPGCGGAPVQYGANLGGLRLMVLDSTRPGQGSGELDRERLDWLDGELAADPDTPTVVALHHPPLVSGLPAMDNIGLAADDRHALGQVLERHRQVRRVLAGHVHRAILGDLGGCEVFAAPSTYAQALLDWGSEDLRFGAEPPGYAVHALLGGGLVSHIQSC